VRMSETSIVLEGSVKRFKKSHVISPTTSDGSQPQSALVSVFRLLILNLPENFAALLSFHQINSESQPLTSLLIVKSVYLVSSTPLWPSSLIVHRASTKQLALATVKVKNALTTYIHPHQATNNWDWVGWI
jgi:hypothetical protein